MEARRRIVPGLGLVGAIALTLIWAAGAQAYPTYRNTARREPTTAPRATATFAPAPSLAERAELG